MLLQELHYVSELSFSRHRGPSQGFWAFTFWGGFLGGLHDAQTLFGDVSDCVDGVDVLVEFSHLLIVIGPISSKSHVLILKFAA